ncbi:MAG: hypothetical protein ALECFALPRED_010915 [Alectoria fallacina]|uniref:Uncharacterized protein n=1 Tax=Alectoria fallacina TaxID=1903189 RepID=A0A8H3F208_9LECA|nr:MAG: hypothetical protein ALECFALPRED_010915 [Alectoria fallacina]
MKAGIEYITHVTVTSTFVTKSIATHKTGLTPLSISETTFSDADIAIKKGGITHPAATSSSAAKSISPHKSSLSTLASVESTPLPAYRSVSSPPPTYEPYKKLYLTVADLYMRYALLSKPSFIITRIVTVLFIMFMQNLYEKFYDKEKPIIFTSSKTFDSPIKQHATR